MKQLTAVVMFFGVLFLAGCSSCCGQPPCCGTPACATPCCSTPCCK